MVSGYYDDKFKHIEFVRMSIDEFRETDRLVRVAGDLLGDADADSDDGTPVLLRQPDVVNYIVKGKPVTLTCEASSAVLINFKCVDHWMRPEEQLTQPVVDAITGATYLRTSIEVSRHHVEEYGADAAYMCWCHAWNRGAGEPRSTMSRKARVQVACEYIVRQIMCRFVCVNPAGNPYFDVFRIEERSADLLSVL